MKQPCYFEVIGLPTTMSSVKFMTNWRKGDSNKIVLANKHMICVYDITLGCYTSNVEFEKGVQSTGHYAFDAHSGRIAVVCMSVTRTTGDSKPQTPSKQEPASPAASEAKLTTIKVFDLTDGLCVASIERADIYPSSLQIANNGKTLLLRQQDKKRELMSIDIQSETVAYLHQSTNMLKHITAKDALVGLMQLSDNKSSLQSGTVKIWDAYSGKCTALVEPVADISLVHSLDISSSKRVLVAYTKSKATSIASLKLWSGQGKSTSFDCSKHHLFPVTSAKWIANSEFVTISNECIKVWRLVDDAKVKLRRTIASYYGSGQELSCTLVRDSTVMCLTRMGTLYGWNVETGDCLFDAVNTGGVVHEQKESATLPDNAITDMLFDFDQVVLATLNRSSLGLWTTRSCSAQPRPLLQQYGHHFKTGDLLFFKSDNAIAKTNALCCKTDFSGVGMIIRDNDKYMLWYKTLPDMPHMLRNNYCCEYQELTFVLNKYKALHADAQVHWRSLQDALSVEKQDKLNNYILLQLSLQMQVQQNKLPSDPLLQVLPLVECIKLLRDTWKQAKISENMYKVTNVHVL